MTEEPKSLTVPNPGNESSDAAQDVACMTPVNPPRGHGVGPLGGARVVWGVRIDERLKERVQPKMRHFFGSDCRAMETWLMAFEVVYDDFIVMSGGAVNRLSPSINIESLNVVRAQRSRRKLDVDDPIGYSVDENAIVQETVNRFTDRFDKWGARPNRMDVLKWIRHAHPQIEGKTRMKLTSRIEKELTERKRLTELQEEGGET